MSLGTRNIKIYLIKLQIPAPEVKGENKEVELVKGICYTFNIV